jgi:hypothetical protein
VGLAAKVEKLDTVPEPQRGLYKELEDKSGFVLDVDGAEDVFAGGLRKNRDQVLTEKKKLELQLKEYEGLTPAEVKELKEFKTKQAEATATAKGDYEALKQQLVEKHNGDLSKATAREQKLLQVIEKNLASKEAASAITKLGGNATLLLPHVMQEIRVVEDGDDFKAIVVAKDGKTPRIKNGSGDAMSIEDLVAEFKERKEYGGGFAGTGSSGSGAGGAGSGGGQKGGSTHKISAADAKDNRKYVAAKAAADKAGVELDIVP